VTAVVLDGIATASAIKAELKVRIAALRERDVVPGLGTLLVGEDPGSLAYVGGNSHEDISRLTGNPLGTVKSWIRRGLQSLRKCLES